MMAIRKVVIIKNILNCNILIDDFRKIEYLIHKTCLMQTYIKLTWNFSDLSYLFFHSYVNQMTSISMYFSLNVTPVLVIMTSSPLQALVDSSQIWGIIPLFADWATMRSCLVFLLFLAGCLAFQRVPLYRMKTARRTLQVIIRELSNKFSVSSQTGCTIFPLRDCPKVAD